MSVPFRAGEALAFRVLWSKYAVSAGTIELKVIERRDFFGRTAWHFQALAHSMDTMRILYALDDQFDSYTDAAHLTSLQYEMYVHEQGKQQNGSWRLSAPGDPAPPNVTVAHVVAGTRDPVGLLYALRAADWSRVADFRVPVFDGHTVYDVTAKPEQASGEIEVLAGKFAASRIGVSVSSNGTELDKTHFSLWLAQDPARTPVLLEATTPFGDARVELSTK
jgi:hypothetical protein